MIFDTRKRASALEILVNSPGRVGEMPWELRFSSSTSAGNSVVMSTSRRSIGVPVAAEVNLVMLASAIFGRFQDVLTYQGYIATRRPSSWSRLLTRTDFGISDLDGVPVRGTWSRQFLDGVQGECSRRVTGNITVPIHGTGELQGKRWMKLSIMLFAIGFHRMDSSSWE